MRTKQTSSIRFLFILSVLISATLISVASAAIDNSLILSKCSLGIYPFNPNGTTVSATNKQWFNLFEAVGDPTCNAHLQYPNQYTPQPPVAADNNLKNAPGIDTIHAPQAIHTHTYHNASLEDNFYYKSYVDTFQIILENDALTNTDKDNVDCITPDENNNPITTPGCNTQAPLAMWGGTSIKYDKNSGVATWKFGTSGKGRPRAWGNNPSLPTSRGFFGTSVRLTSKNNPGEVWSATTTSRVLLRDMAFEKGSGDANNSPSCANDGTVNNTRNFKGTWCTLAPPNVAGIEGTQLVDGKEYYWFRIGVVGTVWKKSVPPPPQANCVSIAVNPLSLTVPGTTNLTATVTFDDGKSYDTEVTWTGVNGNPPSKKEDHVSSAPYTFDFTTNNQNASVSAKVTNIVGAKNSPVCQTGITITPKPQRAVCTGITLKPTTLNIPGLTNLTATVSFSDGKTYDAEVTWTGTNGNPTSKKETLNSGLPFTFAFNSNNSNATVNAKVTNIVGADNSPLCIAGADAKGTPQQPVCDDTQFTLTSSNGNPLQENQGSILQASGRKTDGSPITDMQWTTTGGSLKPLDGCMGQQSFQGSRVLPASCRVQFSGGPAGTVITVSSFPPENGTACRRTITVEKKFQPKPYCESLDLQPPQLKVTGSTDLTATVRYSDGIRHRTTVLWQGDGTFKVNGVQQNTDTQGDNTNGDILFRATFSPNKQNAQATAKVISVQDPNITDLARCQDSVTGPVQPPKCEELRLYENGNQICVRITRGTYNGDYTWTINNKRSQPTRQTCQPKLPNTSYAVEATSEPVCRDSLTTPPDVPKTPPRLEKGVKVPGRSIYKSLITARQGQPAVEYQLIFTPTSPDTSVTITDDIGSGGVKGRLSTASSEEKVSSGTIQFDNSMTVREKIGGAMRDLDRCGKTVTTNCYNGSIGDAAGIRLEKVNNPIYIEYRGRITGSAIQTENCKKENICQETYKNNVRGNYTVYMGDNTPADSGQLSDFSIVQIFCQYILTRAAGDIYLETDLSYGIDIAKCSDYKSTSGVIIRPRPPIGPIAPITGGGKVVAIKHEVCSKAGGGGLGTELENLFGDVSELSSQICEVKLIPGSSWEKSAVTNTIEENKTRISRWEPTKPEGQGGSVEELLNLAPDAEVYRIKGANLTVNNWTYNDGQGAKTFIVEDGDLVISGNIQYGTCTKEMCTVRDMASLAFIVLNGNIYVDPNVTDLAGIFFVQKGSDRSGYLYSGTGSGNKDMVSEVQLKILGSVYGDIEPLFQHRSAAGDPALNEGSIVIRFDERIILNTPQGLQDLVDLSQSEVAR